MVNKIFYFQRNSLSTLLRNLKVNIAQITLSNCLLACSFPQKYPVFMLEIFHHLISNSISYNYSVILARPLFISSCYMLQKVISFEEQDVNRNLYQDRHRRFKNETDVPRKIISNFLLKRQGAVSTSSEFLEIWRRRTQQWRFFGTETRYSTRAISRKLLSFVAFVLIPSELVEKLLAGIGRINADETRELSNCNLASSPRAKRKCVWPGLRVLENGKLKLARLYPPLRKILKYSEPTLRNYCVPDVHDWNIDANLPEPLLPCAVMKTSLRCPVHISQQYDFFPRKTLN